MENQCKTIIELLLENKKKQVACFDAKIVISHFKREEDTNNNLVAIHTEVVDIRRAVKVVTEAAPTVEEVVVATEEEEEVVTATGEAVAVQGKFIF